ncbi:MAG TPA: hypothetical protein VD928_02345 [Candidatus Paceibacterota bacterium]|nr:hypothetical protein [Candidatus Paceibacterota bacterium]
MDPQIEELKELVRRTIAVSEDTNRTVHKMRRDQWWGRAFRIFWVLLFLAVSGAAYYYYVAPYLETVRAVYEQIQTGAQNTQSFGEQFQNFFRNFTPGQQQ